MSSRERAAGAVNKQAGILSGTSAIPNADLVGKLASNLYGADTSIGRNVATVKKPSLGFGTKVNLVPLNVTKVGDNKSGLMSRRSDVHSPSQPSRGSDDEDKNAPMVPSLVKNHRISSMDSRNEVLPDKIHNQFEH